MLKSLSVKPSEEARQNHRMQSYYKLQAKIYDATRWSFLFGRKEILRQLPFSRTEEFQLLEVGCGTGYNLSRLCKRYPNARFCGMDVSEDMLMRAGRRIRNYKDRVALVNAPYSAEPHPLSGKVDVVLFSYMLTMVNPQWPILVERAKNDLKPGGIIAVVDFHYSPIKWFRRHMAGHHVRMEKHLLPILEEQFQTDISLVKPAYGGVWQYFLYTGRNQGS